MSQDGVSTDGVSTAFEVILEELDAVAQEVDQQGAKFWSEKKLDEAARLMNTAQELAGFRKKLDDLREEWISGHDTETRSRVQIGNVQSLSPHHKSPKTGLRVTLPGGKIIHESVAADTFTTAIATFGLDKVRILGKKLNGFPLISSQEHPKYKQRKVGGWWVMTHCDTQRKKTILDQIVKALKIAAKVEILD